MNYFPTSEPARPVLIAVPFYRNEQLVGTLAASLALCADDIGAIGAEVVFYNDSPDYPPLEAALRGVHGRVETNPGNLGFVRTMNRAVDEAVARGMDLIVLNSDTELTQGALTEMVRVMQLDAMHGFVIPRSDNATIATLPLRDRLAGRSLDESRAAYVAFAERLPPYSYVPTAVGFCLLIRWQILAEFGGFDEVYGLGYNEENDLVMRASRVGYRAVMANHAFVAHLGEASFSLCDTPRPGLERRNRAILDQRFPEYDMHTRRYYDTPEVIAERLLACLTPDEAGLVDVALDCSSFVAARNGTFQAGRQLIAAAARDWQSRFRVFVLCSQDAFDFHEYADLGVIRGDPHDGRRYAAIFRVGQPYDWNTLQRLCMKGAVLGVYMLDTISLDCPVLTSPLLHNLWQFTMDWFDVLATQSRQTDRTIRLRLCVPQRMICVVAPHSMDLDDYLEAVPASDSVEPVILVVGNHYAHKYVAPTANALAAALPDRQVLALGMRGPRIETSGVAAAESELADLPNLAGLPLGDIEESGIAALYARATAVVFPSFAEGFGFPTLNALAARRPLFARRLPATEEIWIAHGRNPNVHFYDTTQELVALLQTCPVWLEDAPLPAGPPQSAIGIGAALSAAMEDIGYARIVSRVRAMHFASDAGKFEHVIQVDPPAIAAGLVAARVERVMKRAFDRPLLFRLTRYGVRGLRFVRRRLVRPASP